MQRNSFKPIDTVALKTRHQSMDTLWAQLASTAKAHALRPALIHGNESILYGDLAVKVDTARVALSSLQLAPGQRCAIVAEKNSDVVVAILAALHLRVVLVIIHPILKAQQISHILRDSGATALMCNSRKTEQLVLEGEIPASLKQWVMMPERSARHDTPDKEQIPDDHPFHNTGTANSETGIIVHDWQKMIAHSQATRRDIIAKPESDELAVILYTSGSTGMPKGVMLSHSNLYHGALSVTTYLKNNEHDRILALMPFSFDYGLSQLTTAMFSGAALILHDYMMPRGVIDLVGKLKITGIPAVPHVWDQLVKTDWPDTEHLRYITNTGGRLQLPTIEKLRQKLPDTAIYSMYGFTEAFRATFLYPDQLAQRPDSIGKAVPYADVLIVDSEGNELNAFERGELIQSGPLVSQGYWNDPTGTAARIRPRYVEDTSDTVFAWSGDEAYKDDEGYIYFVSRKDDLVKLNGYRVSPSEIEMTLLSCPWINEVCILCVPDDHFGNVAIAFVVLASPASHSDLTNWCKSTLPSFMVPARWTVLDKLPVTPNNKIDRAALASIEGNVPAAPTRHN